MKLKDDGCLDGGVTMDMREKVAGLRHVSEGKIVCF
jgi:hypothetical protein